MAADVIILHDDQIQITMNPPCLVPTIAAPVPLVATGFTKISDRAVCVVGDELPPSLRAPLTYTAPPFVTPGTGTLKITLEDANDTEITLDKGKKMLLKGSTFQVEFSVASPAMQPTPTGPVPDSTPKYKGTAQFISTNTIVKAE